VQKFLTSEQKIGTGDHRFPVRLPRFWAENPAVWFAQMEAHFQLSNVDDDLTKFNCVIAQLGPKYAARVEDVICNPPADGKYNLLKTELLNRLRDDKLKAALTGAEIGHKRPSEFLRLLRELGGNQASESLVRSAWLGGLPRHVQPIVSALSLPLDSLAEVADKVMEVQPPVDLDSIGKRLGAVTKQLNLLIPLIAKTVDEKSSRSRPERSTRGRSGGNRLEESMAGATRSKLDVMGCPLPGSVPQRDLDQDTKPTSAYHSLLNEFPDILHPSGVPKEVHRSTQHRIVTKGARPVTARRVELSDTKVAVLRDIMDSMVRQGTARPSNCPHGSDVVLMQEERLGGGRWWRPFGDYRQLNSDTVSDVYRMRHLVEISDHLWGCNVFSVVKLRTDWTRIPMAPEDIAKTAVATPFGKFEFPFMPAFLLNSEKTWQKSLDEVLQGLPWSFGYLDAILVFSRNHEDHLQHMRALFQRLSMNGIYVSASTSVFGEPRVNFSNYSVSSSGCTPIAEKTAKAIENMARLKNHGDLQRFLRLTSAYRRYIPASLEAPFTALVEGSEETPFYAEIPWTSELDKDYRECKSLLSRAALYSQPDPFAPMSISVSVWDRHVGAVLHQKEDVPLAFMSEYVPHPLEPEYEKHIFGIYKAIKTFRPLIGGRDFTVLLDRRFRVDAFFADFHFKKVEHCYMANYCSQFTSDIQYIKRSANALARCLATLVDDVADNHTNPDSADEVQTLNVSSRIM